MDDRSLRIAPVDHFPTAGRDAWASRIADGPGGEIGRARAHALCTAEDLPPVPGEGRRETPGWVRVAGLDGAAPEAARSPGEGLELSAPDLGGLATSSLDVALFVESHVEPLVDLEASAARAGSRLVVGGFDPLGALARDGALPRTLEAALSGVGTIVAGSESYRALRVDVGAYHRAGADPVQELAYALGTLAELLRAAEAGGRHPSEVAAGTALAFEVGRDLFGEVAKLRAARVLWARIFGAAGMEEVPPAWIHATTAARTLTRWEPMTNVLRATTQAFAAAVAGADSIRVRAHDAALGAPTPAARRLARNLQTVLAEEAHLDRTADPAGGSFLIERRTDELARSAWNHFRDLERSGGMAAALLGGRIRAEVDESWSRWRARLDAGEADVLGVTVHAGTDRPDALPRDESPAGGEPWIEPLPLRREASDRERQGVRA